MRSPSAAAQTPTIATPERRRSASTTTRRARPSTVAIQRTARSRGRWCNTWLAITTSTDFGPNGSAFPSPSTTCIPLPRARRAAVRFSSTPTGFRSTPQRRATAAAAMAMSPDPVPTSKRVQLAPLFPLPASGFPMSKNCSSSRTTARVPPNRTFSRPMSCSSHRTAAGSARGSSSSSRPIIRRAGRRSRRGSRATGSGRSPSPRSRARRTRCGLRPAFRPASRTRCWRALRRARASRALSPCS